MEVTLDCTVETALAKFTNARPTLFAQIQEETWQLNATMAAHAQQLSPQEAQLPMPLGDHKLQLHFPQFASRNLIT